MRANVRSLPAVLLALALAAPAPAPAQERLAYAPAVDVPLTVATGVYYLALHFGYQPDVTLTIPVSPPPTGIDSLGVLHLDSGISQASDYLLTATVAGAFVWDFLDGLGKGEWLERSLLFLEAAALNAAVTETVKYAVDRPRPYSFSTSLGPDDVHSFFSGHTSFAAMATFTLARSLDLTSRLDTTERVLLYGGATALTGTVAALRVLAGKHWPTDTIAGAAVGATIGFLVPELHRAPLVMAPMPVAGGAGVSLTGTW